MCIRAAHQLVADPKKADPIKPQRCDNSNFLRLLPLDDRLLFSETVATRTSSCRGLSLAKSPALGLCPSPTVA